MKLSAWVEVFDIMIYERRNGIVHAGRVIDLRMEAS